MESGSRWRADSQRSIIAVLTQSVYPRKKVGPSAGIDATLTAVTLVEAESVGDVNEAVYTLALPWAGGYIGVDDGVGERSFADSHCGQGRDESRSVDTMATMNEDRAAGLLEGIGEGCELAGRGDAMDAEIDCCVPDPMAPDDILDAPARVEIA